MPCRKMFWANRGDTDDDNGDNEDECDKEGERRD